MSFTASLLPEIQNETADCLLRANADMVGHTGVLGRLVNGRGNGGCLRGKVVTAALEHGYAVFLTADHGNTDYIVNEDSTPNTAHTLKRFHSLLLLITGEGKIKEQEAG